MATLDFVVSHPSVPKLNALPIAARTVTLHVPDSLDPYHQQQLRDALADEFHRGSDALALSVAVVANAKSEGCDRPLDAFVSEIAELQSHLEQSAGRWLAIWSGPNQPSILLPADDRAVIVQEEQAMLAVLALVEQARYLIPESKRSEVSARQLGNELDVRLGRLSERLEAVLELPAEGELEDASRAALIQQLFETIHSEA